MKLFKNGVGRPSNEILKKRKIYRIGLFAIITLSVLGGAYFLLTIMFPIIGTYKQAASNVDSSKMTIQVTSGNSTRTLLLGDKQYASGTWISQKQLGSNTVFVNKDGNTKIRVKATLTKSYLEEMEEKRYAFWVVAYNKYGKRIASTTLDQIDKEDFTAVKDTTVKQIVEYTRTEEIKVTKNVKFIRVIVQDPKSSTPTHYIQINTALLPSVTLKPSSGKTNSNGIVQVEKAGKEYKTYVTIDNPSKATLWYKWAKYKSHSMTNPEVQECKKITSTKVITRGLYVKEEYPARTGQLRVYTSLNSCKKDVSLTKVNETTGNIRNRSYAAQGVIKYELAKTYNAGSNWIRIRFDYDGLSKKIGKQARGICFNYALSYGTYINNYDGTYTKPNKADSTYYGATSYNASNYYDMYTKIKKKIDVGIPVSIHVGNADSAHHWVLVTGYKNGLTKSKIQNSKNPGSVLRGYLYVLDPYDLVHGPMSQEKQAAWFYGDMRYITW